MVRWKLIVLIVSISFLLLLFWNANGHIDQDRLQDEVEKLARTLEVLYSIAEENGDRLERLEVLSNELDKLVGRGEIQDEHLRSFIISLIQARGDGIITDEERKILGQQMREILENAKKPKD